MKRTPPKSKAALCLVNSLYFAAYDKTVSAMAFFDPSRKADFEFISGSMMRVVMYNSESSEDSKLNGNPSDRQLQYTNLVCVGQKKDDCGGGQKTWTKEDMDSALDALRTHNMSLTKASVTFGIPSTTLWQRAHRMGIDTPKKEGPTSHPPSWVP